MADAQVIITDQKAGTRKKPLEKKYTIEDYEALPEDVHAELIYGRLYYMAAPSGNHQILVGELQAEIRNYLRKKGYPCRIYPGPFSIHLFNDDKVVVEPDISVICDRDKLDGKQCNGAPDWIIEVASPGNFRHDYLRKLNLYAEAGVREYWIVDPMKKCTHVYHFEESDLNMETYSFADKVKAGIYEDLEIDFAEFRELLL